MNYLKLYIIGNGFDINLGLNTRYKDFYYFLKDKYPDFLNETGEILWAKKETDPLWSFFERELSHINFMPFAIYDNECSSNISIDGIYNMKLNGIFTWKYSLSEYFREWIARSYKTPSQKNYNFNDNDYFINFNYTPTLEDVFLIERDHILYLHGKSSETSEELIFGHGTDHDMMALYQELNLSKDGYIECTASQLNDLIAIDTLLNELRKPVDKIKMNLEKWLLSIPKITEIVVLGHSLGEVDLPYFELVRDIFTDAEWVFSFYSESDKQNIQEKTRLLNIQNYRIGTIDNLLMQPNSESAWSLAFSQK